MFEYFVDGFVLFDQINGSLWTDSPDGVTIITAKQYTQINELKKNAKVVELQ